MRILAYLLSFAPAISFAMVLKFPEDRTPDSRALEATKEYIFALIGDPEDAPTFLHKLQATGNLSPDYLDQLTQLLVDYPMVAEFPSWNNPDDPKDELLALIPRILTGSKFRNFHLDPKRRQIVERIERLRQMTLRDYKGGRRAQIFDEIAFLIGRSQTVSASPVKSSVLALDRVRQVCERYLGGSDPAGPNKGQGSGADEKPKNDPLK